MARLRVVTLNLWGDQARIEARLDVAAAGLAALAPDVVCLQEIRVGEGLAHMGDALAARLPGMRLHYRVATAGIAGTWGPGSGVGEEGLAILTRLPALEVRDLELPDARPGSRRILLSARLDVAGREAWVHTTHLHWRLSDGVARERQVVAIDEAVAALGRGVPHILAGDLNAAPDCDEIRFLAGRATLAGRRTHWQDAFARARPHEPGWTWARRNPQTAWLSWLELDRRIDYVFVSTERPDGRGRVVDARVVLDEPGAGGVFASDHFGVLADVEV